MPTDIPEGYGLIPGRGSANARAALDAAEAAGADASVVETVDDGYLVPEAVLKKYEAGLKKPAEDKPAVKKPASKKS